MKYKKKVVLLPYLLSIIALLAVPTLAYTANNIEIPDALKEFKLERSEYSRGVSFITGDDETKTASGGISSFRFAGSYKGVTAFYERDNFIVNLGDQSLSNSTTVASYIDSVLGLSYGWGWLDFRLTRQNPKFSGSDENLFLGIGLDSTKKSSIFYGRIFADVNLNQNFNLHATTGLKIPVYTKWLLYSQPFAEIRGDYKTAIDKELEGYSAIGFHAGIMWMM